MKPLADNQFNPKLPPFNDRFDPDKNRYKVMFHPDRPLQQAELNELQSIAENNVKQLGNGMFNDGSLYSGMAFVIDAEAKEITIEDGQLYVAGKMRQFNEQTIAFTGEGTENIGVKVVKRIIDHNEDPTLLDQTSGVTSSFSAGADRLEELVYLTVNDDSSPKIYEFREGELFLEPDRPEFALLNEVLATRTYEESGSYRVEGFEMWTDVSDDLSKIDLMIDGGKAYVLGYRISKPSSTRVKINKATDSRQVVQETHTYEDTVREFQIGSSSVKQVTRVVGRTDSPIEGVQMSKGGADSRDAVPVQYTSIDRNSPRVWTNSPSKDFEYSKDYKLIEDNGIQYVDWDTGMNGTEPTTGTTYFMTFEYDRQMREGVDFTVVEEERGVDNAGWDTTVDFNNMAGHKPKDGGLVSIDYEFYLARLDLVILDRWGEFTVIEGQPDMPQNVSEPERIDPLTLRLGSVLIYPNSHIAHAELSAVTRLRMEDLQKMKKRLEDVEYNQAIQQLEIEATITDNPLDLRGVFADGFTNFKKMDQNLTDIAFSMDDASITLRTDSGAKRQPNIASSAGIHNWGRLATAPFIEKREIHQPIATDAWNVNPYAVYNKQGVITIDPTADNWIEEEKITLHEEDEITTRINRWWRHQTREGDPLGELSEQNRHLVDNTALHGDLAWGGAGGRVSPTNPTGIGAEINGTMISSAQKTRDEVIEYIRQREIEFNATNLQPMTNNLFMTFDGIQVPISPRGSTVQGADEGTIRSDSNGEASGVFTIPKDIRTGTREITLQNNDNLATTSYTAQGTRKITEETITRTRVTFNLYDPLAQSFAFPSSRVVTSVGAYFGSKSSTDNIIVQIRGLSEGGYPNRTIYAERLLKPSDISISADASIETKISLDDPLMVKAGQSYCITFITDSNEYTMWVGTLGEDLIDSPNNSAVTQPYVNGVLFSSSNAVTWTAHQKSDLKFSVYTAEFQEEAVVEFEPMVDLDSDKLLLMASFLTPSNTGCYWEVKVIAEEDIGSVSLDNVPWRPLINYLEIDTMFVVGLAQLRATFRANRYISPILSLDDLMFANFITATEGDYVSRNIDTSEAPYNTITLSYDAFTPPGSTITPYYSTDGGAVWKDFASVPNIFKQSAEFDRITYTEKVSSSANNTQFKVKLTLRGENRFSRPRARRLTAVMKDAIE